MPRPSFSLPPYEEFRVIDGMTVEARQRTSASAPWGPWGARSKRSLLAYAKDSALWDWLREHGFTRPKPSGRRRSHEELKASGKYRIEAYVSAESGVELETQAKEHGESRAAALDRILREARAKRLRARW